MNVVAPVRNLQYEGRICIKTSSAATAGHRGLEDSRMYKLTPTSLSVALSYVVSTSLWIKTTLPRGDVTSIHLGNVVCVLGVLILGDFYRGLGGALGMAIGDLFDSTCVVYAPKTFLLKLCIGLTTGLMTHEISRINESSDRRHVSRLTVTASVYGLLFNVIFDPLVGYFYKLAILGKSVADLALAWDIASTSINAVTSVAAAVVIYMSFHSILIRSGLSDRFR